MVPVMATAIPRSRYRKRGATNGLVCLGMPTTSRGVAKSLLGEAHCQTDCLPCPRGRFAMQLLWLPHPEPASLVPISSSNVCSRTHIEYSRRIAKAVGTKAFVVSRRWDVATEGCGAHP